MRNSLFIIFAQFNYSLQEFRKSLIVEEVEMRDKPKNSGAVYEDNGNLSVSSEMEYKSESVGIGLALSRSIITQFNGTIKVTSEVGHGTSFDIRFYKAIV